MSDIEIFKKLIKKLANHQINTINLSCPIEALNGVIDDKIFQPMLAELVENKLYYQIIFNHDVAKTIWGEEQKQCQQCQQCQGKGYWNEYYDNGFKGCEDCRGTGFVYIGKEGWRYHLQQMVIVDSPLRYIEPFL